MISFKNRFHGHTSLRRVLRSSKLASWHYGHIRYSPNGRTSYRAAVIVSGKISRSAVQRNRIRRRLYEAIRQLSPHLVAPHDLVIVVRDVSVAYTPTPRLYADLAGSLLSAGILSSPTPKASR